MVWERYTNKETGFEVKVELGNVFQSRFFCDDPTSGVFTTKAPVAKLIMTPIVQFVNTNIAWDVSNSRSNTGTIDTFDLKFGGGGASDLTGQDWAVDPLTGNVQYTTVGTYQATLTVTDTLGNRSQAAKQTINIIDLYATSRVYIATSDTGMFTYDPGGTPVTANTGLSGQDLGINMGVLNPHYATLSKAQQHYWLCNGNGLAFSTDGCATYTKITKATLGDPTNTAGDGTPPETDDLAEVGIAFDPQDISRVYVLRVTDVVWNASNDPRVFVYFADDYGVSGTWTSFGVGV
jgi:hypothetical protein